jgi:flagellar basal-body rod modification protein FlgD
MTTIPPVSSTPSASAGTSANGTDSTGTLNFTQNFSTFLTLLTTQLQNQDPLNPMDSSQFTNQLVEFSSVEQEIKQNSQLTTMIANQASSEAISALPMVGQVIQYSGNQAALSGGSATYSYTLPTAAASTSLTVQDSSGNTVFSSSGSTAAGAHAFTWNGQNNAGQQLPDGGVYTLQVQSLGANGQPVATTTTAVGTVTGVSVANNVATFNVSGVAVPMNQLVNVIGSASSTPSTPSN